MPASVSIDLVRRLPKAELHCHLDGSVRPETLLELAREYRVSMPRDSAEELREYMLVTDARNLEDYLARFEVTLSVMQSADAIERIAYELAVDAARDGVWYIEVRFAPILNTRLGLSLDEVVDACAHGLQRAEREAQIVGRVIICGLRNLEPETSLTLARLAVDHRHNGVVAFDLAGGEIGNPASLHAEAFRFALEHDLACTCHAGEGDGASSVREAVHVCGAHRIGHATRLFEDESLSQYVNDRRIALEICLTSNVHTRAAESYAMHPMRQYFDRGMNVVLNTDNRLMSGTTLTGEYMHAADELHFTFDDLAQVAMNGFASAFLPWEERSKLLSRVRDRIASLNGAQSS
jgi:adenosine deaminase